MTTDDKKKFAQIMYGLADNFRDNISKEGLKFRFDALKKYSIEDIEHASLELVKTRQFTKFPTIAEFVNILDGNMNEIQEFKAEEQAIKVLYAVKKYGSYQCPKFLDQITAQVISKRFGWGYLCGMDESKKSFFIKEFKSAYLDIAKYGDVSNQIECNTKINGLIENIGGN